MKVLFVSQSDKAGGAGRASWRLFRALVERQVDARLLVRNKISDDPKVIGPAGKVAKFLVPLRFHFGLLLTQFQRTDNKNFHSINRLPSRWAPFINRAPEELVHLHFLAGETLSIEDLGQIRKPLVWTLHDMWAFSGSEHYGFDGDESRWFQGYSRGNRPRGHRGLDWDRQTWTRKRRSWSRPISLVTPSRWLADCVTRSALLQEWPVTVIPNLLDTEVFQPLNKAFCRLALGLPQDRTIVLFGALGGSGDPRKGYDLLVEALRMWVQAGRGNAALGVVFGQGEPAVQTELPLPVRWMGHLSDDTTLALLYNAADVMVVPSRQEAFGQTGSEAQACGTPVVAFAATGLLDVVEDRATGYLARPFDAADLARGLAWVLEDANRWGNLSTAARARALRLWSPRVGVDLHLKLYREVLEASSGKG
jgi:glycosyltransferase involved in cell wall biosynthesis